MYMVHPPNSLKPMRKMNTKIGSMWYLEHFKIKIKIINIWMSPADWLAQFSTSSNIKIIKPSFKGHLFRILLTEIGFTLLIF